MMDIKQFAMLVAEMRKAQRDYFKTPSNQYLAKSALLELSKRLEREVDAAAKSILQPGSNLSQTNLFK